MHIRFRAAFFALVSPCLLFAVLAEARVTFVNAGSVAVNADSNPGPQAVALADVNRDLQADLIVVNPDSNTVDVFLSAGNSGFPGAVTRFPVGNEPVAVIAARFNNDGNLDLATANRFGGTVTILLGNGDGTFADGQDFPVDGSPIGLVAPTDPDLNKDGRVDLAVLSPNTVRLLRGNGDGTFSDFSPPSIASGRGAYAIASGDFDLNGAVDLAVSNGTTGSRDVRVFLGNDDGTFQPGRLNSAGAGPAGIAVGSFNEDVDSTPDIAVVDRDDFGGTQSVVLLFGQGNGDFDQAVTNNALVSPQALISADLDRDNKVDLQLGSDQENTFGVLCQQPSDLCFDQFEDEQNGFQLQGVSAGGLGLGAETAGAVQSGDINNDGRPDIVVLAGSGRTVLVKLNTIGTTIDTPTSTPTGATPTGGPSPTTPEGPTPTRTRTPTPSPTSTPTPIPTAPYGVCNTTSSGQPSAGQNPVSVGIGDFNGDGDLDIAVADQRGGQVRILLTNIDPGAPYLDTCALLGLTSGTVISGVDSPVDLAVSDLDRDGTPDLAVIGANGLSVFYGDGDGQFVAAAQNPIPVGPSPAALAVANFDRDSLPDIIVASGTTAYIVLGAEERAFRTGCSIAVGRQATLVEAQDLNVDRWPDVIVGSAQTNDTVVFLQIPPTPGPTPPTCPAFSGQTPLGMPGVPRSLVVGQFDTSDIVPDFSVALASASVGVNGTFSLRLGQAGSGGGVTYSDGGTTVVERPTGSTRASSPSAIGAADINRDARLDLVVADQANDDVVIFPGAPSGGFNPGLIPFPVDGVRPVGMAIDDIDRDGRPDVVLANAGDTEFPGSVSILVSRRPPFTPTPLPTATPTATGTRTATGTATPSGTGTPTPTPTITSTATRTLRPTFTFTPVPTKTLKPGAIGVSGSCAIRPDAADDNSGSGLAAVVAGGVMLILRRRARRTASRSGRRTGPGHGEAV